uniref:Uncharacterized protein n=1 Tax=Candidatus Kentrum sp. LPFa TaxID=2126335 RepID=A0A450WM36_9GAMM|nr:MAG: hypothetical protein BECKLPF1236A_GA0070988_101903 [Candidatus Kentron sp. LPFa]VFK32985.1 MAG: hypothetical protein BECKLPF1236C_GA0070990_101883 [Candidatus Kentron sp. LPFa]
MAISLAKLRLEPTRHEPNAGTARTKKVAESVCGWDPAERAPSR